MAMAVSKFVFVTSSPNWKVIWCFCMFLDSSGINLVAFFVFVSIYQYRFIARRSASAVYMLKLCDCLSIRPSQVVSSVKTARHDVIIKQTTPHISCFLIQIYRPNSDGITPKGATNTDGLKSAISTISRYILETVQDRDIVTIKGWQKIACRLSNGAIFPVTLSDPQLSQTSSIFHILYHIWYLRMGSR